MPKKPTGRHKKKQRPYRGLVSLVMELSSENALLRLIQEADVAAYDAFARAVEANPDGFTVVPLR